MRRSRTVLDRTALAVVGLVFLLGGSWLALTRAPWATRLPAWWPEPGARAVLVDPAGLAELRSTGWWTPSVMAASIAATVLLALWCVRLLRGGARPSLPLPAPGSTLRTRALEDVVTRHAVGIGGVGRCRTRVLARRKQLQVRLHVRLQPDVAPADVLPAIAELAGRTESSLTPYSVRTRVRFSTRSHRRSHVR
ncbi:hypothetical protein J8N05_23650 [Streptomyces sp. BH-SS-21]|uniref:Alkaline shock response membrane anchor protein AmaP n=1 Tax=Streptomyces liliiviolaceus TaxID=2823109 RepID=A0A940Y1H7_9ACTN|nr:hypothetical protein [Streptomyces liliiviolaceus]MBQ0851166.1 hypothetical protein [Streptomyces liliiviolaceus]